MITLSTVIKPYYDYEESQDRLIQSGKAWAKKYDVEAELTDNYLETQLGDLDSVTFIFSASIENVQMAALKGSSTARKALANL